jgi:hypothetical protein
MGQAMDGPAISEEEHEVTLRAERPVVEKEAVPVERIRLDKETVTDQERVSADVRKEEIEVDGDERKVYPLSAGMGGARSNYTDSSDVSPGAPPRPIPMEVLDLFEQLVNYATVGEVQPLPVKKSRPVNWTAMFKQRDK